MLLHAATYLTTRSKRGGPQRAAQRSAPQHTSFDVLDAAKPEPKKLIWAKRQQVGKLADPGKEISSEHLDRHVSLVLAQFQLDGLRGTREIVDDEHALAVQLAQVSQDAVIRGMKKR